MRKQLLSSIANRLESIHINHPLRIAIDDVDGSGKTTFADELLHFISKNRAVIRISIDGFHNQKDYRIRRGYLSRPPHPAGTHHGAVGGKRFNINRRIRNENKNEPHKLR
jgi:hypothetical protein